MSDLMRYQAAERYRAAERTLHDAAVSYARTGGAELKAALADAAEAYERVLNEWLEAQKAAYR